MSVPLMVFFNTRIIELPQDGSKFCITTDAVGTHRVSGLRLIIYARNGVQNDLSGGVTKLIQANVSKIFLANLRHPYYRNTSLSAGCTYK